MTPRYQIRPLGLWLGPITKPRTDARFRAPWSDTLDLLGRETGYLDAKVVALQVDVTEGELRRDRMLRANAKVASPAVRVSFDSRHGPLTYATDQFTDWQDNVRAVALALQALRAVDRYGVGKTGEQYRGWSALPAGTTADTRMTRAEAAALLADALDGVTADEVLTDPRIRERAYRAAARLTHPDHGGTDEAFRRVDAARRLLDAKT